METHEKTRIGTFVMADGPIGCYIGFLERLKFRPGSSDCTLSLARSVYPVEGWEVERFILGKGPIDLRRIMEGHVSFRVHLASVAVIWELPDTMLKDYLDSTSAPPYPNPTRLKRPIALQP